MGKRCVAAGCSNTHRDGVSLHKFPKDASLRQQWVRQVQRTRADWKEPSEHSVVCSAHFAEPCFEPDSALALAMGLEKRKKKLKPDAVPTLFDRPSVAGGTEEASASSRKRQRSITLSTLSPSNLATCKPKKARVAFEKRERARVSQSVTIIISRHYSFIHASQIVQELTTEATQPSELETNVGEEQDREEETSLLPHDTHSTIGVQVCVEKENASVQVAVKMKSIGRFTPRL